MRGDDACRVADFESMPPKRLMPFKIGYEALHRLRSSNSQAALRVRRERTQNGFKVIVAGSGCSARLPGMAASLTPLPVLGVA